MDDPREMSDAALMMLYDGVNDNFAVEVHRRLERARKLETAACRAVASAASSDERDWIAAYDALRAVLEQR